MSPFMKQIEELVKECGQIILHADRAQARIEEKEGHGNFVTYYDKKVQELLRKGLSEILPEAVFVGEEEETHASIESGYAFIVDPIDGTMNFIKDYHMSAISVGVAKEGKLLAGVIYNPYLDEMYSAEEGCGAYLNGKRIHVSDRPLGSGLVLFGTAPYYEELYEKTFQTAFHFFKQAADLRRSGSAALDLCSIAAGRAELYFELCLCPWDFAAGTVIVREAGGVVTTMEGGEMSLNQKVSILATNQVAGRN